MKVGLFNDYDPKCPHCGYVKQNGWELQDHAGELECPECGKKYEYIKHVILEFETMKIGSPTPNDQKC